MGADTKIEWAHHTFNPWTGCTKVSPGCDHCYAEGWAKRTGGPGWGPGQTRRRTSAANWRQPLKWNAAAAAAGTRARVFCSSLADVFDNEVDPAWRADLFSLIGQTPHLDWLLLTKRIGNVANMVPPEWMAGAWPGNVWQGNTMTSQSDARRDMAKFLMLPAPVRFLSIEPLLSPMNIRAALRPKQPFRVHDVPTSWSEFAWPEWVPEQLREQIVKFWSCFGRTAREWVRDAIAQGGPALWSEATIEKLSAGSPPVSGRFVHRWNNIGSVVHEDGTYSLGSFPGSSCYPSTIAEGRGIDWVIVGGESGPGARPVHPAWVRSLRDQCTEAGVPFLFKQWGEYTHQVAARPWTDPTLYMHADGRTATAAEALADGGSWQGMFRPGKKAAGRELDGQTWDEVPTP